MASTSSVAMIPTGSGSPQMSPTSRPTLLGLLTPTPTNSNSGCLRISAITILPTKPVPQTTTPFESRSDMRPCLSSAPFSRLHPKRELGWHPYRSGLRQGFEVFGAADEQGGKLAACRGWDAVQHLGFDAFDGGVAVPETPQPKRGQLERAGATASRRTGQGDQAGGAQSAQYV